MAEYTRLHTNKKIIMDFLTNSMTVNFGHSIFLTDQNNREIVDDDDSFSLTPQEMYNIFSLPITIPSWPEVGNTTMYELIEYMVSIFAQSKGYSCYETNPDSTTKFGTRGDSLIPSE